ncbi:MAG TPA: oxygen-dependent coproporphyrinogen oxidase [Polyangia bacterium]|jgi:coproporphyrinogen III oxidase
MTSLAERAAAYFRELQDRIVAGLERLDGGHFREDTWERPGGGGGRSRVIADGALFEKGGVNFSDVAGEFGADFAKSLPGEGRAFRAMGVSLVLHPRNPHVPTVHANVRYIQREQGGWFGGGTDLTPYYVVPADATAFHRGLQAICAAHDATLYPRFKAWCDRYFYLPHRKEPRGVGGIFFDYLGAGAERAAGEPGPASISAFEQDPERVFAFVRTLGDRMLGAYHDIIDRRRAQTWDDRQRDWQLVRRGRYVEFNLIFDRGTLFGLKTDGRTESILMSLPPEVRWRYDAAPSPGSPEAESLAAICAQRDWALES